MADTFILTQEWIDDLKLELKTLRAKGRNEIAEKIKEAKSFGDLSENSEYDEAKSEQGKLEARIAEIEYTLQHAKVLDESSIGTDIVHIGTKVKVFDKERKQEIVYSIVGSPQVDPLKRKIADDSPIGRALVGKSVGDTVEVDVPAGIMHFEILEISK